MLATSPDAVWWGGALVAPLIGAGFLLSGDRIPSRWPWKQVSPTSEKDLARRRKRLIDAGMRTWYGSRINDTTLAELVAASEALAAASATVMAARTGTTLRHVMDRGAVIRSLTTRLCQPSRSTAGLKKRLFLYGPAHRAQMLAKAQGGRFLALRKVGAELYLAAQ